MNKAFKRNKVKLGTGELIHINIGNRTVYVMSATSVRAITNEQAILSAQPSASICSTVGISVMDIFSDTFGDSHYE